MRRRGLPDGARLSSLAGLSVRSLRARPLRAALTTGAIVLGVGMVFGILLLTGTIHSTFSRMYDSIYGRADLVVAGDNSVGALPASTIERVRATPGVETASGTIYSIFRTFDERGHVDRSQSGQLYVVGVDFDQPATTSAEIVAGRDPVAGRGEIEVARDWAEQNGLDVGDRVQVTTPTGVVT